jgi:adenylate cyclase class 2
MAVEVEQKFRLTDRSLLERELQSLGAERRASEDQVDCYYAHPARDFSRTDEALRLRRVGSLNYITYKGPKLDQTTKTRREIEIALPEGDRAAAQAADLLEALAFRPVAQVPKRRTHFIVRWQGREIGISLDEVAELGDFVELEIVAEQAEIAACRDCIVSLAARLALTQSERRSYLELLLQPGDK